jgi:hypothetical protein
MKTAVEWLVEQISYTTTRSEIISYHKDISKLVEQAKEMEKQESYSYDEIRTIAYNAYCLAQLDEPTEGKYNLWIQQYKKK